MRKPVRKALLVAIAGGSNSGRTLQTPHRDALAFRDMLIALYDYHDADITLMLDDVVTRNDPKQSHLVPLKGNLRGQMKKLVDEARPGDRFLFYYNGHGIQIETEDKDEEDGFDEAILPYSPDGENEPILDNELKQLLVEALPPGAALMAIFDCCCAGTLLDLKHYRCNNFYVPWVNRGKRDLRMARRAHLRHGTVIHNSLLRGLELKPPADQPLTTENSSDASSESGYTDVRFSQRARIQFRDQPRSQSNTTTTCIQIRAETDPGMKSGKRVAVVQVRAYTINISLRRNSCSEKRRPPRRALSIPAHGTAICMQIECAEPDSYLECDGFSCQPEKDKERIQPDVISISACQDSERTWEGPSGVTFTRALIRLLNTESDMHIRRLVQSTGHILYKEATLRLHRWSDKKVKEWRACNPPEEELWDPYEIFNSPVPQIGSTYFLPDDARFCV